MMKNSVKAFMGLFVLISGSAVVANGFEYTKRTPCANEMLKKINKQIDECESEILGLGNSQAYSEGFKGILTGLKSVMERVEYLATNKVMYTIQQLEERDTPLIQYIREQHRGGSTMDKPQDYVGACQYFLQEGISQEADSSWLSDGRKAACNIFLQRATSMEEDKDWHALKFEIENCLKRIHSKDKSVRSKLGKKESEFRLLQRRKKIGRDIIAS